MHARHQTARRAAAACCCAVGARGAAACAVCFGGEGALIAGMNQGILFMLGVCAAVATGLGLVVARLAGAEPGDEPDDTGGPRP